MKETYKEKKIMELIDDVINNCDSVRKIGEYVDEVIFDYFTYLCINKICVDGRDDEKIFVLRKIRDLFWGLETEQAEQTSEQLP